MNSMLNAIETIDDFENKNWRVPLAGTFDPSDAPQDFLPSLEDAMELSLHELAVGATFYYESYPTSYPGKFFKFEKDRTDQKGRVCTWLSTDNKFIMNKMEDTYCFSIYNANTKVYILLDDKQRSFSPTPDSEDEKMSSLKTFSASGLSMGSNDRISELEKQVESLIEETNWLKNQLHKIYINEP